MTRLIYSLEAAQMLAARRKDDRLADVQFFPHQDRFIQSDKTEAWLFGANRSGKTDALAALLASMLRFGHPDPRPAFIGENSYILDRAVKCWGVSLTAEMNRNILQPKMFNNGAGIGHQHFIPLDEILHGSAGWNVTNQTLKLKNGSLCIYKADEQGPKAFQGADIDCIGWDEVPSRDVFKEAYIRIGAGRRLLTRGAATILPPPGVAGGVSWMFAKKVRPWLVSGQNEGNPDLDIFTASIYDNPMLDQAAVRKLEVEFPPGTPENRIRLHGELLPSIGGTPVYKNFQRSYHVNSHLIRNGKPIVDKYQPLCLAADFNPANGIWLVGQRIRGMFVVLDEICLESSDIAAMTYAFREKFPTHGAELWIYGDATGRRRNVQTGQSDFHLIQQYLIGYPVPIRFHLPDINPPVKDRVNAVNLQLRPADGQKLVEFSPLCTNTIDQMEETKWRADGKIDKKSCRSDGPDAFGYWVVIAAPTSQYVSRPSGVSSIRSPRHHPVRGHQPFPAQYRAGRGPGRTGRVIRARA